jgi:hypothetical protein
MSWTDALAVWREEGGEGGIPRRGTRAYDEVVAIMRRTTPGWNPPPPRGSSSKAARATRDLERLCALGIVVPQEAIDAAKIHATAKEECKYARGQDYSAQIAAMTNPHQLSYLAALLDVAARKAHERPKAVGLLPPQKAEIDALAATIINHGARVIKRLEAQARVAATTARAQHAQQIRPRTAIEAKYVSDVVHYLDFERRARPRSRMRPPPTRPRPQRPAGMSAERADQLVEHVLTELVPA